MRLPSTLRCNMLAANCSCSLMGSTSGPSFVRFFSSALLATCAGNDQEVSLAWQHTTDAVSLKGLQVHVLLARTPGLVRTLPSALLAACCTHDKQA